MDAYMVGDVTQLQLVVIEKKTYVARTIDGLDSRH